MQSIENIEAVYFVGIKGVGMTALALIYKEMGKNVGGVDSNEVFLTDEVLRKNAISYCHGFDKKNIDSFFTGYTKTKGLVVFTGANGGRNNLEVHYVLKKGISVLSHAEALAIAFQFKKQIVVSGTHGKTTTSAWVAHLLTKLGKHPSYAIGAPSIGTLGNPGHWGTGAYAVLEGDEYITDPSSDPTPRFHYLNPFLTVITSIEYDHPDAYRTLDDVYDSFITLIKKTKKEGSVIACIDNDLTAIKLKPFEKQITSYGFSDRGDIQVLPTDQQEPETTFFLKEKGRTFGPFTIRLAGLHNVLNATAALIAVRACGISFEAASAHLSSFTGTKRRMEVVRIRGKQLFLDDYAHHPTEIRALLQAVKSRYPNRPIIALFQPHTYSRTQALLGEFGKSFQMADIVGIADIFASKREEKNPSIDAKRLVREIAKHHHAVFYVHDADEFLEKISSEMQADAILITVGAGDIYRWHETFSQKLP